MSTIRCCMPMCQREVELSCNCTSPATYLCKDHLASHCGSSRNSHNITSISVEDVKSKKEQILGLLVEKNSKNEEIRANIMISITQILCRLENILKQVLRVVDSESTEIDSYFEKIRQVQKLSIIEKDPALHLLTLQSNKAVEKVETIFTVASNNNIRLFFEIIKQIDAAIQSFYEGKSKVIPHEMHFEFKHIDMNFENEVKNLQPAINNNKEAIKIEPSFDEETYNEIGNILENEKRYEEAVQHYNSAIRRNPECAIYYRKKGNALIELGRRNEAVECYKEIVRIDPNDADTYSTIGDIFYDEKRCEEAVKYYNDAIRINPKYTPYYKKRRCSI